MALSKEDRIALALGVLICAIIVAVLFAAGFNALVPSYHLYNLGVYAAAFIFVVGAMVLHDLARHRPASPIRYLFTDFLHAGRRADLRRALLYALLLAIFGTLFSLAKRSIPLFNDYGWDMTLIAVDRAIHGGRDAWLLLQPVFGYPRVTWVMGNLYHLWVLLIYLGSFYFIFAEKDAQLRARYVLAYMLSWTLIGFVTAAAFASVGPCFARPILGIHTFDAQMAYLRGVDAQYPLMFLDVQDKLLSWYRDSTATLGAGIAAMPSMHVAQAVLFALAMRRKHPVVAGFFALFAVVILLGSVHLAYHYAVDGYVAIIMTVAIWGLAGLILSWLANRPARSPSVRADSFPA